MACASGVKSGNGSISGYLELREKQTLQQVLLMAFGRFDRREEGVSTAETLHKMAPHWVSADVIRPPSNRTCRSINCILPEYDQNRVQSPSMDSSLLNNAQVEARRHGGRAETYKRVRGLSEKADQRG